MVVAQGVIRMTIPICPAAQKRVRARAIRLKNGIWTAQTYKDTDQRIKEDQLIAFLKDFRPDKLLDGPISLNVIAYLPIPKSKSRKWKVSAISREILPDKKPDLDNLIKHLKDCMRNIFYHDDRQIVALQAFKYYSLNPCWDIELIELAGGGKRERL